jgi:Fur family peroxide stress response transcriptional regulator
MKLRRNDITCPQAERDLRLALERAGRRYTRQRAAVCAYLRGVLFHPTAEHVFAAVRREIPHISLGTVYKALEALVAAGVASRLDSAAGPARYDGRSDTHYHYRCDRTGEVCDLPLSYDPQLLERIAPNLVDELRGRGFVVTGHRLELVGHFVPQE